MTGITEAAPVRSFPSELVRTDAEVRHRAYLGLERFPALDGLRALSILPVIWHHATPHQLEGVLGKGPLGVHLFFAISGFLITTLLLRERRSTGSISLTGFYARRSLRIFPLYYAVLGLYVVRAWLFLPDSPMRAHFFGNLPYFATYTSNFLVDYAVPHPVIFAFAWSLATEEQFYLFWPWLLRFAKRAWVAGLLVLGLFAVDFGTELGWLARLVPIDGVAHRMITSISAPICLGALLALMLDRLSGFRILERGLGRRASAPIALVVLAALIWQDAPLVTIHLAMVALVGAVSIRADHGLVHPLEMPTVRYLGSVSYGMYLFHVAAITGVRAVLPQSLRTPFAVFLLATAATLLVSALSYRFFERPFLDLRSRFRPRSD